MPVAVSSNGHAARPLRLVQLGKYYPPARGGMESHVQTLARAQAALGADVTVVCVNHQDREGRDVTWRRLGRTRWVEEADGPVRVIRVGRLGSVARCDFCPGLPAALGELARGGVDILHLHTPNPAMVLSLAWMNWPGPLLISHHSDVVRQKLLGRLFRPIERRVYRRAARVLSDSAAYIEGSPLLQWCGDKVTVLPMGIDLAPLRQPSAEALAHAERSRAEFGEPLWLFVGRLVYYKGLDTALAALAKVPGRLLIVGTGPLQASLERQAQNLGVAERVHWLGDLSEAELIGAYHAATALWFPSNARSEGYGLVQVEALAAGCPVLNTAIAGSGVSWVSPDGETGLTVPVNDPEALAAAATRLVSEPGLRERLSQNARERAVREFDSRLMGQRSVEIYQHLLGEKMTGLQTAGLGK